MLKSDKQHCDKATGELFHRVYLCCTYKRLLEIYTKVYKRQLTLNQEEYLSQQTDKYYKGVVKMSVEEYGIYKKMKSNGGRQLRSLEEFLGDIEKKHFNNNNNNNNNNKPLLTTKVTTGYDILPAFTSDETTSIDNNTTAPNKKISKKCNKAINEIQSREHNKSSLSVESLIDMWDETNETFVPITVKETDNYKISLMSSGKYFGTIKNPDKISLFKLLKSSYSEDNLSLTLIFDNPDKDKYNCNLTMILSASDYTKTDDGIKPANKDIPSIPDFSVISTQITADNIKDVFENNISRFERVLNDDI